MVRSHSRLPISQHVTFDCFDVKLICRTKEAGILSRVLILCRGVLRSRGGRFGYKHRCRGAGVELRLYQKDPDAFEARAKKKGYKVLRTSLDRPHGLRECYLLDLDGYFWVASAPLAR